MFPINGQTQPIYGMNYGIQQNGFPPPPPPMPMPYNFQPAGIFQQAVPFSGNQVNVSNNNVNLTGRAQMTGATANQLRYGIYEQDKGVNGMIDEGVFQGDTGDCWLLSGVLSMSYTPEGAQIIKDAISQNPDGSYNVYFKGIDKSYTVSKEELQSRNVAVIDDALGRKSSTYSTGDDDMLLMECALEKVVNDKSVPIDTVQGITGGSAYYLYQLMTDKHVAYAYGDTDKKALNTMLNYYGMFQDSCAATVGVIDSFLGLEDDHAYAVAGMHNGYITLVNPWDSTIGYNIPMSEMAKYSDCYDMSLVDYDLPELMPWQQEYYA